MSGGRSVLTPPKSISTQLLSLWSERSDADRLCVFESGDLRVSKRCEAATAKGRPCGIGADRNRNGRWLCHVHDPMGVYQRQRRGELPVPSQTPSPVLVPQVHVDPGWTFINPVTVVCAGTPGGDAPF